MNTTRTPSRARQLLVVPVLLAALTGLAACGADDPSDASGSDTTAETATPTEDTSTTSTGTVELVADGSTAGKCAVPSAEMLAGFDTAFEGTVQSVEDGVATLQVDQWYAGADQPATVTVEAPSKDLQDLLMAVDFEQGKTYLVSATDDRVTLCGFTSEKTPELEALYTSAFAL